MATYFIGQEYDAFYSQNQDSHRERGDAGEGWWVRGVVECWRYGAFDIFPRDYTTTGQAIAVPNVWLHGRMRLQPNPDQLTWIQWFGPSDTPVVRMETRDSGGSQIRMTYYLNGTWTPVGDWYSIAGGAVPTYDFHVKIGSSGKLEFFVDGIAVASLSTDTSSLGNISRVRLGPSRFEYDGTWYTEVILASYSTVGHRVRRKYPIANGTYTDWTGDYTAVDEFGDSGDAISTDAVGSRETYTGYNFDERSLPIKAVAVAARIRVDDEAAPRAYRALLVMNGSEYTSPPVAASVGFKGSEWVFDKNPATNGNWSTASVNSAEFGVKSSDGGSN